MLQSMAMKKVNPTLAPVTLKILQHKLNIKKLMPRLVTHTTSSPEMERSHSYNASANNNQKITDILYNITKCYAINHHHNHNRFTVLLLCSDK